MKSEVSNDEITAMVRQVLVGQDLSKITGKIVRERIVQELGDRVQPSGFSAIKETIKASLKVVLQSSSGPAVTETATALQPNRDTTKESSIERTQKPDHSIPKVNPLKPKIDRGSVDTQDDSQLRPRLKKRARKFVSSDSESKSDSESQQKPRRKKTTTTSVQKRTNVQPNSREQPRLDQLKKLCRKLGCPVPPAKLRGVDPREKYDNIVQYLHSKGVQAANPLSMSSHDVSEHRERIAREKELEGLDVKNIIEAGGRLRRRTSKPVKQLTDKLPSDLSGEELSEDSESAESEGYAAPSGDSE
ncbi:unnamed protein product [Agarophyton chilense]